VNFPFLSPHFFSCKTVGGNAKARAPSPPHRLRRGRLFFPPPPLFSPPVKLPFCDRFTDPRQKKRWPFPPSRPPSKMSPFLCLGSRNLLLFRADASCLCVPSYGKVTSRPSGYGREETGNHPFSLSYIRYSVDSPVREVEGFFFFFFFFVARRWIPSPFCFSVFILLFPFAASCTVSHPPSLSWKELIVGSP